jgi:hypothetical protein
LPVQSRCRSAIAWGDRTGLIAMLLDIRFFSDRPFVVSDPAADLDSPLHGFAGLLVRHPKLTLADDLTPRLVDLRSVTPVAMGAFFEAIDEACANAQPLGIDAALSADSTAPQIAEHLGLQSVRSLGRFGKHLVRVWDPHVLMHLLWIWPANELRALFGPISAWALLLPGEVVHVERSSLSGQGLPDAEQRHQAVIDVSILNAALSKTIWRFSDVASLGPLLWQHVRHGRGEYKLRDEADLALFARQARRWGVSFVEHPDIRRALTTAADGETLYRDALAQVDEQRMQHIEAELSAHSQE